MFTVKAESFSKSGLVKSETLTIRYPENLLYIYTQLTVNPNVVRVTFDITILDEPKAQRKANVRAA